MDSFHEKHKNRENVNDRKIDPHGGPLDPKNGNFSTIAFWVEPSIFFI